MPSAAISRRLLRSASRMTGTMSPPSRATATPRWIRRCRMILSPPQEEFTCGCPRSVTAHARTSRKVGHADLRPAGGQPVVGLCTEREQRPRVDDSGQVEMRCGGALGAPAGRDAPDGGERDFLVVGLPVGRSCRGGLAGLGRWGGRCQSRRGVFRGGSRCLDIGPDDPAARPCAGDGGQVDAVAVGYLPGERRSPVSACLPLPACRARARWRASRALARRAGALPPPVARRRDGRHR